MNVYVFIGPSIGADAAREHLPGAHYLGPAACGDVYRAARNGADVIALCDGYFEHHLSVWHKEILWALSNGVLVYGASSMGALRAAELVPFGMVGVGWVFEQYRDQLLTDDDEVAVVHDSKDDGYRCLSEALVNMRVTLERARADSVISVAAHEALLACAKRRFYPERSYAQLFSDASQAGFAEPELRELRRWLPSHRIDQKALDALSMLRRIADDLPRGARPATLEFSFRNTDAWQAFVRRIERNGAQSRPREPDARTGTALRALADTLARTADYQPSPEEVQACSETFRSQHGLFTPEQTRQWLSLVGMDLQAFSEHMYHEARVRAFWAEAGALLAQEVRRTARLERELLRGTASLREPGSLDAARPPRA